MLQLKKHAKNLPQEEFRLGECPVCYAYVCHQYFMRNATTKKESKWFSCSCGVVFQDKKPVASHNKKPVIDDPKLIDLYEYPVRIYSPIIEELIYGRRVLIVGGDSPHQEIALASRGWVPTSVSAFESHKFLESQKFNLIWLDHALECFLDPIASLKLCHTLLAEDGIIYIATPDTDFINTRSSTNFMHWNPETNYLMWNRRALSKQLEQLGFNVIMSRQNCEPRFVVRDDLHMIAQKKFF